MMASLRRALLRVVNAVRSDAAEPDLAREIASHLALLEDPSNLLRHGVVVRHCDALDGVAEIIGRYRDSNIYRYVTFKGMRYDFERDAKTG